MPYSLEGFAEIGLTEPVLRSLLAEHAATRRPALDRLWRYYRNPQEPAASGPAAIALGPSRPPSRFRQAQEAGLPPRLTEGRDPADPAAKRREIVIENDIAWRVQAMVDFMFGKPVRIVSTARDPGLRDRVGRVLDAVWEASGGIALLQDAALVGHVYGTVDLILRVDARAAAQLARRGTRGDAPVGDDAAARPGAGGAGGGRDGEDRRGASPADRPAPPAPGPDPSADLDAVVAAAVAALRVELVEPTRGVPVLDPLDERRVVGYALHTVRHTTRAEPPARGALAAFWRQPQAPARRVRTDVVEVLSGSLRQLYEDGRLVEEEPLGAWTGGLAPVAHVQNISQPFHYDGLSEVEPLIPLQDELNTRLSDRASRVTLQSFKMYLAKGLDGFEKMPVGPGVLLSTDNPDASIQAFGGDADSPSEAQHIQEIREAIDKVSAVPPLASGVVRARIGNLTSANALRITMMGVLAKTARKRVAYGRGIARVCALALAALDELGVLPTAEADRGVRLDWADPLPVDVREEVASARLKADLGVPRGQILDDLGLSETDAGVV